MQKLIKRFVLHKFAFHVFVHIFTKYWLIIQNNISQSSVATQLRCDGMFSNHFIANFP